MERKRIEVEAKFPLHNKEFTTNQLNSLGIITETNNIQKDIYYTPAHENFLEKNPISEWLRVRNTNEETTINYKNWTNNGKNNKISCKEVEIGIDDYNGMIEMLEALDFKKIIVVEKIRNTWEYNNIMISLDTINDLGNFIELEFKTNLFDNEEDSLNYLKNAIQELGIEVGEQIFAGYPQLLMKKNESNNSNS